MSQSVRGPRVRAVGRLLAWPPVHVLDSVHSPDPPHSYLCFESSKSGSSKRNKVIKLVDITDIQKVGATPHLSSGRLWGREAGSHPGSGVG